MSEDKLKEAEKLIREAETKKKEACEKEIEAILEKHGFNLGITTPRIIFTKAKDNGNG